MNVTTNVATPPEVVSQYASQELVDICIVDDEPSMLDTLRETLASFGYRCFGTTDPEEALKYVSSGKCRVILCDLKTPGMEGLTFLERALQRDPGVYVILMTGFFYSIESAIEAVKRGAYDYLPKPLDRQRLKKTIEDLSEQFDRRRRIRDLEQRLVKDLDFHGIVGRSPAMIDVFEMVRKISRHYVNVLLVGPTGSGKELVAHAIHQMSPVANQRFAICNCSAIVDTLLEQPAIRTRSRRFHRCYQKPAPDSFVYADGGDRVSRRGEWNFLAMQAKLLRK